mmetsp:Transcript_22286/g.47406  ORF Transcript_22286/g.47406 Transcript_22286/m.47406 type:complete len:200 (-) Transcript_22286:2-601(-)
MRRTENGPFQALHLRIRRVLRQPESVMHRPHLRLVDSAELLVCFSCRGQVLLRLDCGGVRGGARKGLELLHKVAQLILYPLAPLGEDLLLLSLELICRMPGGGLVYDIRKVKAAKLLETVHRAGLLCRLHHFLCIHGSRRRRGRRTLHSLRSNVNSIGLGMGNLSGNEQEGGGEGDEETGRHGLCYRPSLTEALHGIGT